MSKVVRSVKNVTKGYTSAQVKVRNATSNDAWGPVGSDMAEIAQMTYDTATFYEIMDILDKRLNDKGKNWRHVLKSLKVLDYCLHEGSEHVVTWSRKNIYIIKTLREFQYIDEDQRDVGQNVRVSAKELTALILDEDRLRAERQDRRNWKSRVTGLDDFQSSSQSDHQPKPRKERRERTNNDEDDLEFRLALEASKNEAEEDAKRRSRANRPGDEDDSDLAKAIKLSKEEEELRRRELEDQNAHSLFDDNPTPQPAVAQPTGYNQGYQQQPAVDWFGNTIDQQQQNTGFGMPQQTGYQNGFGYNQGFQQQPTGYQNPMQTGFMQPQQTSFHSNNPYQQQQQQAPVGMSVFGQPQSPTMQQETLNPGSNNPWASTNNNSAADALKPMPTGSNNPFASRPVQTQPTFKQPSLNTLAEQSATTSFNNPISNYQAPQPVQQPSASPFSMQQPVQQKAPADPHHARLNALLASGEGQDTFGNTGDLRIPAQHTAPGVFVNSAGAGTQRLTANATGNPFMQSQFTGMPNATYGQRQMPAQTGPVGQSNPFGMSGYGQQQQQQGQQGGSLIDL